MEGRRRLTTPIDRGILLCSAPLPDDRGEKPIIKKDMDGPPILKEEVSAAIRKMKHGKAVGPDNIPIEVFAVLEDIGIDFLTKLNI